MSDTPPPLTRRELRLAQATTVPRTRREARGLPPREHPQTAPLTPPAGAVPRTRREARALAAGQAVAEPTVEFAPTPPTFERPAPVEPTVPDLEQASPDPAPAPRMRKWWAPALKLVAIVAAAVVLTVAVKVFMFRAFTVTSESMEPTLLTGDNVLLEMVTPHFEPYKTGDVVVFKDPSDWMGDGHNSDPDLWQLLGLAPETTGYLVKRIIGVPGDTVEGLEDGTILINGVPLDEPYRKLAEQPPFTRTLGADEYWVMGDYREVSSDSRQNGPIDAHTLVGRAWLVLSPDLRFVR